MYKNIEMLAEYYTTRLIRIITNFYNMNNIYIYVFICVIFAHIYPLTIFDYLLK